jgi:hypothetical protein
MDELFERETVRGKFKSRRVVDAGDMESGKLDDEAKRSVQHIETKNQCLASLKLVYNSFFYSFLCLSN